MKIGVRLFLSSMTFGIVIAAIYAWTTHDPIGAIFLGAMALALAFVAGYIIVAEREANLASDSKETQPSELTGEMMGAFSTESAWPIVAALGVTLFLLGLVFLPGFSLGIALVGAALLALSARALVREST